MYIKIRHKDQGSAINQAIGPSMEPVKSRQKLGSNGSKLQQLDNCQY